MTFSVTIGKYGGFYTHLGYTKRICLGWIAFDIYPCEIDAVLKDKALRGDNE